MRKKRPEKTEEDARGRILAVAGEVFAEKGLAGARVDEIARRAGVNKAMLYYHVGDKRALYLEVIRAAQRQALAAMVEARASLADPEAQLRALVGTICGAMHTVRPLPRIILREIASSGVPDPILQGALRLYGQVREVLEEGQARGAFRKVDPIVTHFLVAGGIMVLAVGRPMMERMVQQGHLETLPEGGPDALAKQISDLIIDGLRAAPAERRGRRRHGRPSPASGRKAKGLSLNTTWSRRRPAGMHGEEAIDGRCGAVG